MENQCRFDILKALNYYFKYINAFKLNELRSTSLHSVIEI